MLAKIGRENRFPRDPHMLGLLSWKQEQVEGALYCTVLYCTVLYCTVLYCTVYCTGGGGRHRHHSRGEHSQGAWHRPDQSGSAEGKYIDKSICKISTQFCLQTGLCRSVNPGDVVFTRIWFSSEATEEETFTKLHFESSSQSCGKPILTGKSNFIACACVITHYSLCAGCYMLIRDKWWSQELKCDLQHTQIYLQPCAIATFSRM